MNLTKLQRTVIDALEDIKAQDIRVYDTKTRSDLFDRVIIASVSPVMCENYANAIVG